MSTLRIAVAAALAWHAVAVTAADPLGDAFRAGSALGRTGNAGARANVNADTASSHVPGYTTAPPEMSYFGTTTLGAKGTARAGACADSTGSGFDDQSCNATRFSQTNPGRRAVFDIPPTDPVRTRAQTITADPEAIAGSLAGTYSDCRVETATRPDIFETRICHQYRTVESSTCDRILVVTPVLVPGCSPGQFLARVIADPCPSCIDYIAYDFSCGTNDYRMHVHTIERGSGSTYMDLGTLNVPGTPGTDIPRTAGPSAIDGYSCYTTHYSQACSGSTCAIGAWFANPCQGTSYYGVNTFVTPTSLAFRDDWDDRCTTLEARTR